jgi:hypothetical protein
MGDVCFSPAPAVRGRTDARIVLEDPEPIAGRHAYWVEVVQVDGARAGNSPIYMTIG